MIYVVFEKDFIDNSTRIVEVVETELEAKAITADAEKTGRFDYWDYYYAPVSKKEVSALSSDLEEEF